MNTLHIFLSAALLSFLFFYFWSHVGVWLHFYNAHIHCPLELLFTLARGQRDTVWRWEKGAGTCKCGLGNMHKNANSPPPASPHTPQKNTALWLFLKKIRDGFIWNALVTGKILWGFDYITTLSGSTEKVHSSLVAIWQSWSSIWLSQGLWQCTPVRHFLQPALCIQSDQVWGLSE